MTPNLKLQNKLQKTQTPSKEAHHITKYPEQRTTKTNEVQLPENMLAFSTNTTQQAVFLKV